MIRLSRLAAVVAAFVALAGAAHAATLTEVVARYEQWRGGAAFVQMQTLHQVGAIETGKLTGKVDVWASASGKVRQDVDLGVTRQSIAVGGPADWRTNLSGQLTPVSPAERAEALQSAAILFDAPFRGAAGAKAELLPPETREGAAWDVVRITHPGGAKHDYFLQPATGALSAVRVIANGQTRFVRYDDWRMVKGVRLPFVEDAQGAEASSHAVARYDLSEVGRPFAAALLARPQTTTHASFAGGAKSSGWLPFEFFGENRIFIAAEVNGRPVQVLLDSGAEATVFDRAFATQLNLAQRGEVTAQGTGGASTAALLSGVNVKLGDLTLSDLTTAAIDLAAVEKAINHPLPVILGGEAFQDCVIEIDFKNRRIAFHDPRGYVAPADAVAVPLVTANGIRTLDVTVEGRTVPVDFDLGNGSALILNPPFWEAAGFLDGRRTSTTMAGAVGGVHEVKTAMVRELKLGGATFHAVPATLAGEHAAASKSERSLGNVGLPVLARFRLIVDFPRDRVLFAAPDAATPFRVDHSGFSAQPAAGGLRVAYVAKGGPAEALGLKAGDVITAVDGAPVVKDGKVAPQTWRFGPPGRQVRLTLAGGAEKQLTLAEYY